jgi:hypothetical protein
MRPRSAVGVLVICLCACGKSRGDPTPEGTSASAWAAPSVTATTPAASASSTGAVASWHGSYKSTAGTLYVPPNWKGTRWSATETGAGVGDGTIALTVDSASGRVTGTLEGALGPASIEGSAGDGRLSARIRRKDPSDRGFEGSLIGALSADHGEGTMNVALAEANALRTAAFTLSPGSR